MSELLLLFSYQCSQCSNTNSEAVRIRTILFVWKKYRGIYPACGCFSYAIVSVRVRLYSRLAPENTQAPEWWIHTNQVVMVVVVVCVRVNWSNKQTTSKCHYLNDCSYNSQASGCKRQAYIVCRCGDLWHIFAHSLSLSYCVALYTVTEDTPEQRKPNKYHFPARNTWKIVLAHERTDWE